jgi:hypothetical protein
MTVPANAVTTPDVTNEIVQQFFIEGQSTGKSPLNYLDHFPETVWNKGIHTRLVALMYTLLGPSGVGYLRQNYLEARIAIENNGLKTTELDELYNNIFSFARFATEVYEQDTEGLLTQAQFEQVQESDKAYQNRAKSFLAATRAGGTILGIELAAKSGLLTAVEVIENYKALYDEHSDDRLGIQWQGVTRSTEEVILLPRQELPTNALQILDFTGELPPLTGSFTLAFPLAATETVENVSQNNPSTAELSFESGAHEIQEALEALPGVGNLNIHVTGGPLPSKPIEIEFTNELADRVIPPLLVTKNTCANAEELQVVLEIEQKIVGASADGGVSTIPPENWQYAEVALRQIKPVTTIISPGKAPSVTKRQVPNSVASDSEYAEVLRYVTGSRTITWPPLDSTHWIEGGVEKEAPQTVNGGSQHYLNFHNISTIKAYTGEALLDPDYEEGTYAPYPDEHHGIFSAEQRALYPFLNAFNDPTHVFEANEAAPSPSLPVFKEGPYIEGVYPLDYTTAPGAKPDFVVASTRMWSSEEHNEGSDILEIDFGTVQACNFITFEASNKPYEINVAYDLLDASPERHFVPVTFSEPHVAQSVLSIGHETKTPNPWVVIPLNFGNTAGGMIYTRFIRLEFTKRTTEGSPFTGPNGELKPFSIEVRSLRIGRNVS